MEGQVTDVEQEVIITNNNLLFHFSGHNNDLLVLKQWNGAAPRPYKNNDLALRARSFFSEKVSDLRHHPTYIFSFFVNYKVKLISGVVEYIYVHVVIVGYSVSLFYVSLGKYMPRKPCW